ncbi:uncharacterized protein LOC135927100 [Gordionus sp. m RMFG-2023]|uniref:uncharacterized protein LOC135927100 n=1 Tax=Gordionus sp. m RMFG-2023 TaxID=3053472 RepID=UPI0031FC65DF
MAKDMISYMKDDLNTKFWVNFQLKEGIVTKFQEMKVEAGKTKTFDEIDQDYKDLVINDNDSYYKNIDDLKKFHKSRLAKKWRGEDIIGHDWNQVDVTYIKELNTLRIPITMMRDPSFTAKMSDSGKYGIMGYKIAAELIEASGIFDPLNVYQDHVDNETKELMDCVKDIRDEEIMHDELPTISLQMIRLSMFTQGLALKYASKMFKGFSNKKKLIGFTNEYQEFFTVHAQSHCLNVGFQSNHRDKELAKYELNQMLRHNTEYQEAFGCKRGDNMVADKICEFFPLS